VLYNRDKIVVVVVVVAEIVLLVVAVTALANTIFVKL